MDILRYIFIVAILLVFSFCQPVDAAKHIIVIYDASISMVRLNIGGNVKTYMKSEDINRVNNYLTDLLFKDTSQPLRNANKDTYIKECDAAYVGKSLYQSGDILTYANYADLRDEKITRKQVQRGEFQRQLPTKFTGQVSYLLRAEVEVFDELYRAEDDETYWVFITDGDVDNSGKSDPGIRDVLKRHTAIEGEYDDPMIVSILVNNHVRIQVRRIQKRGDIDAVFIANRPALNEPIKEIQLSKDDAGQFISETLIIDTKNADKTKFKLNNVNVEVFDKFGKPLEIVKDANGVSVLKVASVSLNGHSPPHEFQIPLPSNPEITAPGNTLKFEIFYNYNGKEKTYPMPPTKYETVIKSIFVSDLDNPNQQENELKLRLSESEYLATLVVRSESPNKDAFRIENIHCHIKYKDDQKLCDVSVPTTPQKLDEPFQIKVPNAKDLDWFGNKLVLNIDYQYEGTSETETIEFPFDPSGGNNGFLIGVLILIGIVILVGGVVALVQFVRKMVSPPSIEYQIMLQEVSEEGMSLSEGQFFSLTDGEMLSFGVGNTDELYFDVGSSAVLRCRRGEILLCDNNYDEEERAIRSGETLTLTQNKGDEVQVYFKIVDDEQQSQSDSDYTFEDDDDLLPD